LVFVSEAAGNAEGLFVMFGSVVAAIAEEQNDCKQGV
jgi:hypothetical protein